MIKTLASFLTIYSQLSYAQPPPFVQIPAVTSRPQVPQIPAVPITPPIVTPPPITTTTTTATPVQPAVIPPEIITSPPPITVASPPPVQIPPLTPVTDPPVVTQVAPATDPPVATQAAPATDPPMVIPVATDPPAPVTTTTTTTAPPTAPLMPPNIFIGPYGQQCDYNKSPLKDAVCKAAGQVGMEQYPGKMSCERGYDCCLCQSISCGNSYIGCITFSAGDSGVAGVKDIKVIGRSEVLGGAAMNFIGNEAGAHAVIRGENIKTLNAAGPLALHSAHVIIVNPIRDFSIECIGMGACQNALIEVVLPGPPPGYQCNPAWIMADLEFNSITCAGPQSCLNTRIVIRNEGCRSIDIQQIECVLPDSCMNTQYEISGQVTVNSCDIGNAMQPPTGLNQFCNQQQQQPLYPGYQWINGMWVPI